MFRFVKTKKGFTLTELLLVVAIIGIIVAVAVPVYNGFTKSARIRNCGVGRITIQKQAESWCKNNKFNEEAEYKVVSDGVKGTVQIVNMTGVTAQTLTKEAHLDNVQCCPSSGTYVVKIEPRVNGIPKVTVTCDGGDDGDCHKSEDD